MEDSLREQILLTVEKNSLSAPQLHNHLQIDKGIFSSQDFCRELCQLEAEDLIHLPEEGEVELTKLGKKEVKEIKEKYPALVK